MLVHTCVPHQEACAPLVSWRNPVIENTAVLIHLKWPLDIRPAKPLPPHTNELLNEPHPPKRTKVSPSSSSLLRVREVTTEKTSPRLTTQGRSWYLSLRGDEETCHGRRLQLPQPPPALS